MSKDETYNLPSGNNPSPTDGENGQMADDKMELNPPSPDLDDDKEPKSGLTFNLLNLVVGLAIFVWLFGSDILEDDGSTYLYLAIVVVIHELGHVIFGKSFGCFVKEMQVFFLSFISYKPKHNFEGSSWRNIKWSLGVLPLGGVTVFKSRGSDDDADDNYFEKGGSAMAPAHESSPYIEDKPAWQRLLISAAGVLFNFVTFLIVYFSLSIMSEQCRDLLAPLAGMSLVIAFLNILPVYPLDGGSILFALYEMITGKKPSQSFTRVCGWIGFIFIILFFWVFPEWLGGLLKSVFGLFF